MYKISNILRRLNNKDIKEIKESFNAKNFTSFPRLGSDGKILPSQWKTWQVCQKFGIGYIKGDYESGEFQLNELGKEIAGKIK